MKMTHRKICNPKFGAVIVDGHFEKISIKSEVNGSVSTYKPLSSFSLTNGENKVKVNFDSDVGQILKIEYSWSTKFGEIPQFSSLDELLERVINLEFENYWYDSSQKTLLYVWLTLMVGHIYYKELEKFIYMNRNEENVHRLLKKQKKIVELLIYQYESEHISISPYIENEWNKSLMVLGIDPKGTAHSEIIKKTGKKLMKEIHPDSFLGNGPLFIRINNAVSYLQ